MIDVELKAKGCVKLFVNVLMHPFVSTTTNVFIPAHKFVNVDKPDTTGIPVIHLNQNK